MDATVKLLGLSPSCKFDRKADGKLGELEHVRETELVRDVVPADGELSRQTRETLSVTTYSLVLCIFLLEFSKRLSDEEVSQTLYSTGTSRPYQW